MDYMNCKSVVSEGDTCLIHISDTNRFIMKIETNTEKQTKFGLIKSNDLINHPYGHRFQCKRGWILPLRLTPEFWTQTLPRRTQILYQADISMILLQLDIKPGSIVIEAGTGSGSLSHAILRACRPHGHLYTYDINELRVKAARTEFDEHGLGDNVTVTHRDIYETGCGEELRDLRADACILDLPQTWNAIEHVHKVLRDDGSRLCTFSPCIEQVKQNVAKMMELNFRDITTMECLLRPFNVHEQKLRLWNDDILEKLKSIDDDKINSLKSKLNPTKRAKISEENNIESSGGDKKESFGDDVNSSSHRTDMIDSKSDDTETRGELDDVGDNDVDLLSLVSKNPKMSFAPSMLPTSSHFHAKQFHETVSHSGYLTFATKRT